MTADEYLHYNVRISCFSCFAKLFEQKVANLYCAQWYQHAAIRSSAVYSSVQIRQMHLRAAALRAIALQQLAFH